MREGFETNEASRPWMQLDMGEEVTVKKVVRGNGVKSTSPCKKSMMA